MYKLCRCYGEILFSVGYVVVIMFVHLLECVPTCFCARACIEDEHLCFRFTMEHFCFFAIDGVQTRICLFKFMTS